MHKLIEASVFAAIGVLVFASLLIPVVDNAADISDTFENDEYFITMDKVNNSEELRTISWDKETSDKITVDGVDIFPTWASITIVAEEDNLVRCSKNPNGPGYYLNMVGAALPVGIGNINDKSVSITIENGVITFTETAANDTVNTVTSTFNTAYVINPDNTGAYQYEMKTPSAKSYVLGNSEIYGIGFSTFGGAWQNVFVVSGNIKDGVTAELVSTTLTGGEITVSDTVTTYNQVAGYKDLYQFENVQFTASYNDVDYPLTYSYVIVPATVTAEKAIHADEPTRDILAILPLILICALIMGVVGYAVYSRIE